MEPTVAEEEEQLERAESVDSLPDLDLPSTSSGLSSISGDISGTSGSSGEIPTAEAVLPRLLEPARQKCVGRNNRGVTWGFTSVIGRRKEMEDAIAIVPGFMSRTCDHVGGCTAPGSRTSGEISPVHFFGVYDGHGGSQGILDEQFSQLEELGDEDCPNFAEEVLTLFYRDTTKLLDKTAKLMEQYPDEFPLIDKCLHQLKGSSASIGAIKIQDEASKTREFCKQGDFEEAMASFKQVRLEHDALKARLEPYFQLKKQAGPVEKAERPK